MIVPGRISIVWPYWQRGAAMLRGLASMREHYSNEDVEIVVVDDGSPVDSAAEALARMTIPMRMDGGPCLRMSLMQLPVRQEPLNPCVPINRGVAAATGEFILLTNPETTHREPILAAMRDTIQRTDRSTYVLAGVFCPEATAWHCHSKHARAGYHFCTMLHRDLWDAAGGFDEEYRAGYCYDDPDFVQRLIRADARFVFRDDLVADHHQTEDAKHWRPREDWERNRALYESKWPNPKSHDGAPMTEEILQNWR
jgi:glycosyltransferase involved in cell wall biosynthesis